MHRVSETAKHEGEGDEAVIYNRLLKNVRLELSCAPVTPSQYRLETEIRRGVHKYV